MQHDPSEFKHLLSQLGQKYDQLEQENLQLRQRLLQQRKDYEKILNHTKRSYKIQHKKYIQKYEIKIQELTQKLNNREMTQGSNTRDVMHPKSSTELNSARINKYDNKISRSDPDIQNMGPKSCERDKQSSEMKSTGVRIQQQMPPIEQKPLDLDTNMNQEDDFIPTQYSSDTQDSLAELDNKTPLYQRQWLNDHYTKKFHDEPTFKIDLSTNPITRSKWIASDFKHFEPIDETPPFFFFKDNTSQEENLKQEYYENNQLNLVKSCYQQVLRGENEFTYDILNAYVKTNRYYCNDNFR